MIRGRRPPAGVVRPAGARPPAAAGTARPATRMPGDARRTTSRRARPTGRGGSPAGPRAGRPARSIGGKARPSWRCSRSFQPAPTPTSIRPPLISSTVVTTLAKHARMAERDRRDEHAEPDPLGLAGEPGEDGPGVGRRLAGLAREAREVVGAEERVEARSPPRASRTRAGRRSSSPAGARSSGRSASGTPAVGVNHSCLTRYSMSGRIVHVTRTIDPSDRRRPRPPTSSSDPYAPIIADFRAAMTSSRCASSERVLAARHQHGPAPHPVHAPARRRDADEPPRRGAQRLALERDRPHRPDRGARLRRAHARPGGPPDRADPRSRRGRRADARARSTP